MDWFFDSPTPLIASISALIALFAYFYQRNEKKKHKAYEIMENYARHTIPRLRIIGYILDAIGMKVYTRQFVDMIRFDNSEINKQLQNMGITHSDVHAIMNKVNKNIIDQSVAKAAYNINSLWGYTIINRQAKNQRPELYHIGFEKMIINFLNELESMAMLFRYNIADDEIVFQSMHQTILGHMSSWYYFISCDNYKDENRYYDNLIWLYHKWKRRKDKQTKRFRRRALSFRGRKL